MTTYQLESDKSVHAPGVVRWAINGYAFEEDRPVLLEALMTWKLPRAAAHALLSRAVPFTVEGDTVVFTVEGEGA